VAELGWTTLEVSQEHLENLVSQGHMTVAELATCCVPEALREKASSEMLSHEEQRRADHASPSLRLAL
jgi:hypothetical protein